MKSLCLLILVTALSNACFSQKFSIQPGILHFQAEPGKSETQVIRITNTSDQKISFQAYLGDWLRDSLGGHDYFRADTLDRSCASWVTLSKNFIEVPPKETGEILVILRGPFNAADYNKMHWAMLFLESVQEKDAVAAKSKEIKTEIKEIMRVGIHIYQTPPNVNKASAKALSFTALDEKKNIYNFSVANTGDVMLQCKAYVTLTDVQNGKEYKMDKIEFPMFPEGKRVVKFEIPADIPKGKYSALAILDIGEEETLQAIEKTIEVNKN